MKKRKTLDWMHVMRTRKREMWVSMLSRIQSQLTTEMNQKKLPRRKPMRMMQGKGTGLM
uniref:Uncharacterized protein n=1 Tax=Rhizophora mucronata TaxID=61149 RepID=A0A2P2J9Q2_RHIMU